jgi:hypothetical protein
LVNFRGSPANTDFSGKNFEAFIKKLLFFFKKSVVRKEFFMVIFEALG